MSRPSPVVKKRIAPAITVSMILAWCLFSPLQTRGQITSATADRVDSVSYPLNPARDPLFIFYQTHGGEKQGSLVASLPGPGDYIFVWSRYNPSISGYDPPFSTDNSVAASSVGGLDEGGYRVQISGSGVDTTFTAWVFQDRLHTSITKNAAGQIPAYAINCFSIYLSGSVSPDTLIYYDPLTGDPISRVSGFTFKWTSDNNDLKIPNDTIVLDPNITYQPPYDDTWYILTATDQYGMQDVDSVFYESIQTRAEFEMEYYDKVTGEFDPDLSGTWSDEKGSLDAPLTVRFNNLSKNGATFEWVYLDTLGGIKQTETTLDVEESVEFTYERADEFYDPYLVSTSEEGCIDTFRLEEQIFVVPSQLAIPNVFSPNGDGTNDEWKFKHQSLKKCRITIVDRSGKVVYKRDIEDIYTWEGWDGNVRESSRRAPEGQYFYVVEATGYDGLEYRDQTIIEQWRNNRGNDQDNGQGGGTGGQPPDGQEGATGGTRYVGFVYLFRHTGTF